MAAALFTDASHKIGRKVRLEAAIEEEVLEAARLERSNSERLAALERNAAVLSESEVQQVQHQIATLKSETEVIQSTTQHQPRVFQAWIEHAAMDQRAQEGGTMRPESESPEWLDDCHAVTFEDLTNSNHLTVDTGEFMLQLHSWVPLFPSSALYRPYWSRKDTTFESSHFQMICQDLREYAPFEYWEPSTNSWPIGRSPQQLWNMPLFHYRNNYSVKILEFGVSRLICRAIKDHLLQSKDGLAITLGELIGVPKTHPLFLEELSIPMLNEEILRMTVSLNEMRQLRGRHNRALAYLLPRARFAFFARHKLRGQADREGAMRVRALNDVICDAFAMPKTSTEILARILGILANADIMPNAHTFNIMLTNLPRIGIDMTNILIEAMQACGVPQTEIGLAAILQATAVSDPAHFDYFVRRMDGVSAGTAQRVQPGNDELVKEHPELLTGTSIRSQQPHTFDVPGFRTFGPQADDPKVQMRSPINPELYEALILGYLDTDPDIALRFLTRMENSGLKLNAKILNGLLYAQIRNGNASKLQGARSCGRLQDRLCAGHIAGSSATLAEAVYLLRQIWTDEEVPNMDRLNKLQEYAVRTGLMAPMVDFHHRAELNRDLLMEQKRVLRLLERPLLHFRFTGLQGVENLTQLKTKVLWTDKQPSSLQEFLRGRIAILRDEYERHHGPHAALQTEAQKQLDRDEFVKGRTTPPRPELGFLSKHQVDDDAEMSIRWTAFYHGRDRAYIRFPSLEDPDEVPNPHSKDLRWTDGGESPDEVFDPHSEDMKWANGGLLLCIPPTKMLLASNEITRYEAPTR